MSTTKSKTDKREWCYIFQGDEERPKGPFPSEGSAILEAEKALAALDVDEMEGRRCCKPSVSIARVVPCTFFPELLDLEMILDSMNESLAEDEWGWCEDPPLEIRDGFESAVREGICSVLNLGLKSRFWTYDHETLREVLEWPGSSQRVGVENEVRCQITSQH